MDKYICIKDLETAALGILPKPARDYYKSGATDEQTLGENKLSFKRLRIRPKCLVGVQNYDLRTTVLGSEVSMPVGISPTAMQRMAHRDGELANAKAAQEEGTIYTLSTIATSSIEEVAKAAPDCLKWFQLYIYKDRDVTRNLVERAEAAGFKAIALTVDTPLFGIRRADVRNKFTLPPHLRKIAPWINGGEYFGVVPESLRSGEDPAGHSSLWQFGEMLQSQQNFRVMFSNLVRLANFDGILSNKIHNTGDGSGLNEYVKNLFDKSLTWGDIKWLKSITKLPIIAKGILREDDAVKAVEAGCAGILVSNHGARQLDGVPTTIEALPKIINAVKNYDVEVYLDGGVTTGTDVYKALALGARMVFVGRPALWGLTVGGQAGVQKMLNILRTELEYTLQIAGTPTVVDITRDMVCHESVYSKL